MLVYRDSGTTVATRPALEAAFARAGPALGPEQRVALLIEIGTVEAALADALCPDRDGWPLPVRAMAGATVAAAGYWHSGAAGAIDPVRAALEPVLAGPLPPSIRRRTPEGFAFYGLDPEDYRTAAERFIGATRPARAVVIGIRTIGTVLGAVVTTTLRTAGLSVASYSVRPRGDPFERELRLAPDLEAELRRSSGAHYLVVDEGPGLSGSSFAAVADMLSALGIGDDRIAFFPARTPDPAAFRSRRAERRWERHAKWVADSTSADRAAARVRDATGRSRLIDLSAGRWRTVLPSTATGTVDGRPPVHPWHERSKYLAEAAESSPVIVRFAGLGDHGAVRLDRAERLAERGLGPAPLGLTRGFLALPLVLGSPLGLGQATDGLLDAVGCHLAVLEREFAPGTTVAFDPLWQLVLTNVGEELGPEARARCEPLERFRPLVNDRPAVLVDGRMLPHEWLRTAAGYCKLDALDHHDDHFYPGPTDIAWDLAGAVVELGLGPSEEARLFDRFRAHRATVPPNPCVDFFRLAYLAYRLGYAREAAAELRGGRVGDPSTPEIAADAAGFSALGNRYRRLLLGALERLSPVRGPVHAGP